MNDLNHEQLEGISMKVAILTFHLPTNHGAYFQCLALQTFLRSKGFEVKVLNYQSLLQKTLEAAGFFLGKSPRQVIANAKKVWNFRKSRGNFFLTPDRPIRRQSAIVKLANDFDYIVVGSDIVWSYEMKALGKLDVFFGKGLSPKKGLISYAASMGPSRSDSIPKDFIASLGRFNSHAVRDTNTQTALARFGFQSQVVVDPTMLVSIDDLTTSSQKNPTSEFGQYLLVYCSPLDRKNRALISRFASERGLSVVIAGYPQEGLGKDLSHYGPHDWLDLFVSAEYVLTNTFHGTVFSILAEANFLTIDREAIRNKALHLLREVGLESRYVYGHFAADKFSLEPDWIRVSEKLSKQRKVAQEYLMTALV